jgi:serpin B
MNPRRSALVLTLLAVGCATKGTETDNPAAPNGIEVVRSEVAYLTKSEVSADDFAVIQTAQRAFALDLYREIAASTDPGGNVLVSPYSLGTALGMTYAGAQGNTRSEIASVLHLGDAADALHSTMNAVANSLRKESEASKLELDFFDALWLSDRIGPKQPFLDILSKYYDTGVYHVDFASDPNGVRERINSWVKDKTQGTIRDLLPEGSIDPTTGLVLSNSVYLSAHWQDQFDPASTKDGTFTLENGTQVSVPMMHREWEYRFAFRTDWRAFELPYVNSQISMVFVLPNAGEFAEFEAAFDQARLDEIVQTLEGAAPETLYVGLPKFAFDAASDLVPRLTSLGMKDAFSDSVADFSGIASDPLYISTAVQKGHIAIDEYGTVAAAATAEVFTPLAVCPNLFFDRPFVFLIYDHATGTVLFVGRLSAPGGEPIAGEPAAKPGDPERLCNLLTKCPGLTTSVETCQASFVGDNPSVVNQCADCLQVRNDLCYTTTYCADNGVSACDASACADVCPAHGF